MAKPWARIEQNFINHPKFLALTSNAICLWLEGKNYCDMYHTDGYIPKTALRTFRFYSAKSHELLGGSCGVKPNDVHYAPLWKAVDMGGVPHIQMHDYLDHNECRDAVLERLEASDERKELRRLKNRERQQRFRGERYEALRNDPPRVRGEQYEDLRGEQYEALRTDPRNASCNAPIAPITPITGVSGVTRNACNAPVTPVTRPPLSLSPSPSLSPVQRATLSVAAGDDAERAGRLREELYPQWYAKYRHGAKLRLVANTLEFQDALTLVQTWDDDRLEKLAKIVLITDDEWISRTDRSFRIFAMKASWADDRLRQAEKSLAS